jgi:hypothetical protein
MFYYCMYLKIDLSFYMFAIIFWIRWMVKVVRKNQQRIQINSRTTQPLLRLSLLWSLSDRNYMLSPCSLGLSATRQHYFSLRTNQPPATSSSTFLLDQHQPSATSQTNRLFVECLDFVSSHVVTTHMHQCRQACMLHSTPYIQQAAVVATT